MKMKNIIQISILAGVMSLCYACSGSEGELHEVTQEMQTSRGTDVEATATLETAGTLETILKEAHGDDVANITKLTITGSYNGADHNFVLGTLKNLHTLDMKGATIVADSENKYTTSGWDGYYLKDNTVTYRMFHALETLKSLILPDNLQTIGEHGLAYLSIESIEIPASVTSLGRYAFQECKELSEVKLSGEITSIPEGCFYGCGKLSKIEMPASVEKLESQAFYNCALDDFTLFQNILSFGSYAFSGNNFKELSLTDKITEMGHGVFEYNVLLTKVDFLCNMTSLPENLFYSCQSLNSVTLAPSITAVEARAFYECNQLVDYTPFANVTDVGYYAFHKCGFTELNLPEGVTKIGGAAFSNLAISTLTLPSTLVEIGNDAFNACHNLTTITVPASVTIVGGSFFDNCTGLTSVFWNAAADVPGISTNSWYDDDISPNILLYINNENIKVDASWKNLIMNGVAQSITITPQERFHCPQEFTAKNISYTRNFGLRTSIGGNEGWETIVLPFVPTAYAHESKGVVAPFDSETDTKKHFWLRSLTTEGFADVVAMEANKPYIISMPYCSSYADEYNLNGNVTFSATDVTVAATPETLESAAGPGFALQPVYAPKETSVSIYALNVRNWLDSYAQGSVFAHSLDDTVQPFEAYAFLTEAKSVRTRVIGVGGNTNDKSRSVAKNTTGVPQKEDMGY